MIRPIRAPAPRAAVCAFLLAPLLACTDDEPTGPEDAGVGTQTIDAAAAWAYVTFAAEGASTISVNDRSSSSSWDMGFFATSVMLNGGAAGPGGVSGYCVCQNAGATDGQILAMTAETERADFDAVTALQIPVDDAAWQSDALAPVIDEWFRYNPTTHAVTAAVEKAWKVRTASGASYAKFHVTSLANGTQQHAGEITFEYALQASAGAPFEPVHAATVDVSAGAVHYDLEGGVVVSGSDEWDLRFEGYDIRVNGGVSGKASAGASLAEESFDAIADASDLTASHYRGDAYGGVFDEHAWYRYNLEGNHQIWPTFDVYLIRRGGSVYKVQLTNYYSATGEARNITLRYARLQ